MDETKLLEMQMKILKIETLEETMKYFSQDSEVIEGVEDSEVLSEEEAIHMVRHLDSMIDILKQKKNKIFEEVIDLYEEMDVDLGIDELVAEVKKDLEGDE